VPLCQGQRLSDSLNHHGRHTQAIQIAAKPASCCVPTVPLRKPCITLILVIGLQVRFAIPQRAQRLSTGRMTRPSRLFMLIALPKLLAKIGRGLCEWSRCISRRSTIWRITGTGAADFRVLGAPMWPFQIEREMCISPSRWSSHLKASSSPIRRPMNAATALGGLGESPNCSKGYAKLAKSDYRANLESLLRYGCSIYLGSKASLPPPTNFPRHRRLALTNGRARGEHQHWCDFACTTRVFVDRERSALFGRAEEVVVGRVRHERLLTHIAGDGATVSGGRSSFGV
jgi:hypothetical protein